MSYELEIIKYNVEKGFAVAIEVYKTPEGYKGMAYSPIPQYEDIEGFGAHTNKEKCVELAVTDLRKAMGNFRR